MTEEREGEPVTEALIEQPAEVPGKHARPPGGEADAPVRRGGQRTTVMLLGSGDWSRELAIALQRLGAEVIAVERYSDAPAHRVADRSVVLTMTDTDELTAVVGRLRPDLVVTLTDAVSTDALEAVAEMAEVVPSARSVWLTADRERLRRLAADELGLPTAPFWFVGSVDELQAVAAHAGFPLLVKPVARGRGQSVVMRPDEVEPAWQRAMSVGGAVDNRVLAETVVEIDCRVTLLTVCTGGPDRPVLEFCAPIGRGEVTDAGSECWQPQQMSTAALDAAKSIAARIVKALGGRGLFGVELMVSGDEVYFSDVTVRPYESGLVTLRTQRLSEFELAARALLGMAVDTIMISPGAARVIYAGTVAGGLPDGAGSMADALAVPESDVLVFGAPPPEPRQRLGVALATAPDVTKACERARQVAAALRKFLQP